MVSKKTAFGRTKQQGFSLTESLMVVVAIGFIVFLLANIPSALILIGKSKHLSLAREIAAKQIEDKRAINYMDIGLGSSPISDLRLSLLPQGSGTVVVGLETSPGVWAGCDPAVCTDSEEVKQIVVTVNWTDNSKPQSITLRSIIGLGGINQ